MGLYEFVETLNLGVSTFRLYKTSGLSCFKSEIHGNSMILRRDKSRLYIGNLLKVSVSIFLFFYQTKFISPLFNQILTASG
jgi:hypothetical protein